MLRAGVNLLASVSLHLILSAHGFVSNQRVSFITKKYRTFVLASQAKGMKRFKDESGVAASDNHDDVGDPKHPSKTPRTSKASTSKGNKEKDFHKSPPGMFHSYDLRALGIPEIAWPQASRVHLGKHGYTVVSTNSAANCLLFAHFLFVRQCNLSVSETI